MATPQSIPTSSERDFNSFVANQVILGSRMSFPCVLNSSTMAAQSDPLDIYGILGGTITNHANVNLIPVPPGASMLKMLHEWVGTTPTTDPIVRLFARMKLEKGFSATLFPETVHASYYAPTLGDSPSGLWVPRGNDASGDETFVLSSSIVQKCGSDSLRGRPSIVHLGGATHVATVVASAAVGPTRGLVFGWFE